LAAYQEGDVGALRIVLYAEGGGETTGELEGLRAPGDPLRDEEQGPGHLLVRRAVTLAGSVPEQAIVFEEPLRTRRGRLPRGSDLHDTNTLAQLLTWGTRSRQPDLCVVLVDSNGDTRRKERLNAAMSGLTVPKVIAMAIAEFEAWLIADHQAVARVLGSGPVDLGPPESLSPRSAKNALKSWIVAAARDGNEVRRTLARICDLGVLAKRCGAFATFLKELGALSL